ncbi:hypothetical protein [Allorhizocola rhizosphaerae]|uniref:hypothetical protein n=1 Tax=Allorhizocola rhizosphaerae TaxID=1872709 RepID=UPI000E3CB82C|nr:hypothetical protein [Allorhizocola rhizosphaerae]
MQIFDAVGCDTTITGTRIGRLTIESGVTCLAEEARILGPVTVRPGAGRIATGADIIGPVSANGALTVQLLGGRLLGPVTIDGTTGRAAVLDALVVGPVRLTGNTTGITPIEVVSNMIAGPLQCTGNSPSPADNGLPNSVVGPASGQCAEF